MEMDYLRGDSVLLKGLALWLGLIAITVVYGRSEPLAKVVTFEVIADIARERAGQPFHPGEARLPKELESLNYDTYREISFRNDKALWKGEKLPFAVEFFHPGYLYKNPVRLHEFTATHVQAIPFVEEFFDYGKLPAKGKMPRDSGYAGFKLLFPLHNPEKWDEVAAFLGSSYFRMLGAGQSYGVSARGLALNSGEIETKEEFPIFTEWWLGKPEKEMNTVRLFGMLESASCVGAYDFLVRPGESTIADVSVVLFFRASASNVVKTIGLAPLTSMHWFGENSVRKPDDYRQEVHDSDGLLIRDSQEQFTWRPLQNPQSIQHDRITLTNPKGFGLLQRDRRFSNYQDNFNGYHRVPNVWVEPKGEWGEGELHLVELPTKYEGDDNIVAFWNPKQLPAPMQPFKYGYTLRWESRQSTNHQPNRVQQTRIGASPGDAAKRQFVIDFSGMNPQGPLPELVAECGEGGKIESTQVVRNPEEKCWRAILLLAHTGGEPVDLTCALKINGQAVSEIWRYKWIPIR